MGIGVGRARWICFVWLERESRHAHKKRVLLWTHPQGAVGGGGVEFGKRDD